MGHEHLQGRLSIPYITPTGIIDIKARALGASDAKYLSIGGGQPHLYNVGDLHKDVDTIGLVEGEFNTVVTSGILGIPSVGLPGTSTWQPWHKRIFEDYRRVLILMNWTKQNGEADDAGRKAAKKIKKDLENGLIVAIDEPGDVNELYQKHGSDWLRERIVK